MPLGIRLVGARSTHKHQDDRFSLLLLLLLPGFAPAEKLYNLCSNDITREMRAVKNRSFLTVPFSGSTLGVRIGALAYNLAEAMVNFASASLGRGSLYTSVKRAIFSFIDNHRRTSRAWLVVQVYVVSSHDSCMDVWINVILT